MEEDATVMKGWTEVLDRRLVGILLTLTTIPLLIVGNGAIPCVDGRDFTPFEIGGLLFFAAILPAVLVLAATRRWGVVCAVVSAYHVLQATLVAAWVGPGVGLGWLGTAAAVVALSSIPGATRKHVRQVRRGAGRQE